MTSDIQNTMASSTINPNATFIPMSSDDVLEPSSPAPSTIGSSPPPFDDGDDQQSRRKRKSWGQAIPDYEKILPPGKRAKTDAEKEQRRCERIMRNRRAAATSRDRKKKEFEEMEVKVLEKEEELAWVRSQAKAQMQRIMAVAFPDGNIPTSLVDMDLSLAKPSLPPTPAYSPNDVQADEHPILQHTSPAIGSVPHTKAKNPSPTLTPALFIKDEDPELESLYSHNTPASFDDLPDLSQTSLPQEKLDGIVTDAFNNPLSIFQTFTSIENSGLTQYPAEVLCCGPQCQPESSKTAGRLNVSKWANSILVIQLMVVNAMSNFSLSKMNWLMVQVLDSLEQIWQQALTSPETMDMIFPLIHSLICLPSKAKSSRRAFRMALLRKLLSCSPASARLFDDATVRALQRLSSAEAIQESQRGGFTWASLLTIRWAVRNIERENEVHRHRFQLSKSSETVGIGARSSVELAYSGASIGSFNKGETRACKPGPHVH